MQTHNSIICAVAFTGIMAGQVLAPAEIADPSIRALQQSHLEELRNITAALSKTRVSLSLLLQPETGSHPA
jgi:hypothetical protein